MEDYHHIDEMIRQKFEGFEPVPPESVWEKVRSGLEAGGSSQKPGNISLPIITGGIVLLGLLSMLFLFHRMESTLINQAQGHQLLFSQPADDMPVQDTHQIAGASFNTKNNYNIFNPSDNTSRILTSTDIPVRKPFEGNTAQHHSLAAPDDSYTALPPAKKAASFKQPVMERFISEPGHLESKTFEGAIDPADADAYYPASRKYSVPGFHEDYATPLRPNWSVGFHFNPEIARYTSDDITSVLNYSVQILPRVSFHSWYIQSGIGLRAGGDRGDYRINYNRFLGSYEDVYEVTFDTISNSIVPTYHTQSVDVYDTVPYYSISESRVTFAYLDVPLLVGREWSFNRLSLYLHAGPSFSILLGRSSPHADYPEENIRILNEAPQIPAREQINWQIMAGAGLSYSFTDRVSLSLEPTFRYFLTKEYKEQQLNTRHPHSFGVRAGLIYHINR